MTKRRNTIKCPECGGPAVHEVRTDTVEYKGQKASVRVSGHWCDKCGEAVLEGGALEKREEAYLELRAKVEGVLSPLRVAAIRERLKLSQRRQESSSAAGHEPSRSTSRGPSRSAFR
jgi:HTH-type transcriptional regulator/antitoxin MqsA